MAELLMTVEVAYAEGERQIVCQVDLAPGSTAIDAVQASGIAAMLGDGAIDPQRLGIFSRRITPGQIVQEGDRIEIYRPLTVNPMDARRRRAR